VSLKQIYVFGRNSKNNCFIEFCKQVSSGCVTAHSHPFYAARFSSSEPYVWPSHEGNLRGSAIEPLHKGVVKAALEDELLYKLLASVDFVRVGRVREIAVAVSVLKEIYYEPFRKSNQN
jgi:hypothetical protein